MRFRGKTETRDLEMRKVGIYLREGEEQIGPFYSRQDAERFLLLMSLFGASCAGIEIVERDITTQPGSADGAFLYHDYRISSTRTNRNRR